MSLIDSIHSPPRVTIQVELIFTHQSIQLSVNTVKFGQVHICGIVFDMIGLDQAMVRPMCQYTENSHLVISTGLLL